MRGEVVQKVQEVAKQWQRTLGQTMKSELISELRVESQQAVQQELVGMEGVQRGHSVQIATVENRLNEAARVDVREERLQMTAPVYNEFTASLAPALEGLFRTSAVLQKSKETTAGTVAEVKGEMQKLRDLMAKLDQQVHDYEETSLRLRTETSAMLQESRKTTEEVITEVQGRVEKQRELVAELDKRVHDGLQEAQGHRERGLQEVRACQERVQALEMKQPEMMEALERVQSVPDRLKEGEALCTRLQTELTEFSGEAAR